MGPHLSDRQSVSKGATPANQLRSPCPWHQPHGPPHQQAPPPPPLQRLPRRFEPFVQLCCPRLPPPAPHTHTCSGLFRCVNKPHVMPIGKGMFVLRGLPGLTEVPRAKRGGEGPCQLSLLPLLPANCNSCVVVLEAADCVAACSAGGANKAW